MASFGQIFTSFIPAVGSVTTFLLEIMEPRYAFFVKHKICWNIEQYLYYYILYSNISNFWQFLGKFLPHSLQLLVLWPPFCRKSWSLDILFLWNTKICWNIKQYLNYYILYRNIRNFRQFWGNFLPCSQQTLAVWLHFCLKSW